MENESSVAKPRGVLTKDIQSMNYMLLGHFSDSNTSGTFNKLNVSQVILSPPSVDLPLDSSWLHNPVTAVTWPLLSRDSYFQGLDSIFKILNVLKKVELGDGLVLKINPLSGFHGYLRIMRIWL